MGEYPELIRLVTQAKATVQRQTQRFFSNEPPRKGFEKFYPKGKQRRTENGSKGILAVIALLAAA